MSAVGWTTFTKKTRPMRKRHSMTSVGLTAFAAILFVGGAGLVFLGALLKLEAAPEANWLFAGGLLAIFLSLSVYIASVVTPLLRSTLGKGRLDRAPDLDREAPLDLNREGPRPKAEEELELRELGKEPEKRWDEEDLV